MGGGYRDLSLSILLKRLGIMLGYVSGVAFRTVLDGGSDSCSNDQPVGILLGIRCVSPCVTQFNESKNFVATDRTSESQLAVDAC